MVLNTVKYTFTSDIYANVHPPRTASGRRVYLRARHAPLLRGHDRAPVHQLRGGAARSHGHLRLPLREHERPHRSGALQGVREGEAGDGLRVHPLLRRDRGPDRTAPGRYVLAARILTAGFPCSEDPFPCNKSRLRIDVTVLGVC